MQPMMPNRDRLHNIRKYCVFSLLVVTPLGFGVKLYNGPAQRWFNDYGAGLLYEIFCILIVFFIFPKEKLIRKISIWVFIVTCAFEALQLWHPKFLESIRSYFIGSALIGTTFSWWDFANYAFGCFLGWQWLRWLNEREKMGSLSGSMF
jgi:hypothetical protein